MNNDLENDNESKRPVKHYAMPLDRTARQSARGREEQSISKGTATSTSQPPISIPVASPFVDNGNRISALEKELFQTKSKLRLQEMSERESTKRNRLQVLNLKKELQKVQTALTGTGQTRATKNSAAMGDTVNTNESDQMERKTAGPTTLEDSPAKFSEANMRRTSTTSASPGALAAQQVALTMDEELKDLTSTIAALEDQAKDLEKAATQVNYVIQQKPFAKRAFSAIDPVARRDRGRRTTQRSPSSSPPRTSGKQGVRSKSGGRSTSPASPTGGRGRRYAEPRGRSRATKSQSRAASSKGERRGSEGKINKEKNSTSIHDIFNKNDQKAKAKEDPSQHSPNLLMPVSNQPFSLEAAIEALRRSTSPLSESKNVKFLQQVRLTSPSDELFLYRQREAAREALKRVRDAIEEKKARIRFLKSDAYRRKSEEDLARLEAVSSMMFANQERARPSYARATESSRSRSVSPRQRQQDVSPTDSNAVWRGSLRHEVAASPASPTAEKRKEVRTSSTSRPLLTTATTSENDQQQPSTFTRNNEFSLAISSSADQQSRSEHARAPSGPPLGQGLDPATVDQDEETSRLTAQSRQNIRSPPVKKNIVYKDTATTSSASKPSPSRARSFPAATPSGAHADTVLKMKTGNDTSTSAGAPSAASEPDKDVAFLFEQKLQTQKKLIEQKSAWFQRQIEETETERARLEMEKDKLAVELIEVKRRALLAAERELEDFKRRVTAEQDEMKALHAEQVADVQRQVDVVQQAADLYGKLCEHVVETLTAKGAAAAAGMDNSTTAAGADLETLLAYTQKNDLFTVTEERGSTSAQSRATLDSPALKQKFSGIVDSNRVDSARLFRDLAKLSQSARYSDAVQRVNLTAPDSTAQERFVAFEKTVESFQQFFQADISAMELADRVRTKLAVAVNEYQKVNKNADLLGSNVAMTNQKQVRLELPGEAFQLLLSADSAIEVAAFYEFKLFRLKKYMEYCGMLQTDLDTTNLRAEAAAKERDDEFRGLEDLMWDLKVKHEKSMRDLEQKHQLELTQLNTSWEQEFYAMSSQVQELQQQAAAAVYNAAYQAAQPAEEEVNEQMEDDTAEQETALLDEDAPEDEQLLGQTDVKPRHLELEQQLTSLQAQLADGPFRALVEDANQRGSLAIFLQQVLDGDVELPGASPGPFVEPGEQMLDMTDGQTSNKVVVVTSNIAPQQREAQAQEVARFLAAQDAVAAPAEDVEQRAPSKSRTSTSPATELKLQEKERLRLEKQQLEEELAAVKEERSEIEEQRASQMRSRLTKRDPRVGFSRSTSFSPASRSLVDGNAPPGTAGAKKFDAPAPSTAELAKERAELERTKVEIQKQRVSVERMRRLYERSKEDANNQRCAPAPAANYKLEQKSQGQSFIRNSAEQVDGDLESQLLQSYNERTAKDGLLDESRSKKVSGTVPNSWTAQKSPGEVPVNIKVSQQEQPTQITPLKQTERFQGSTQQMLYEEEGNQQAESPEVEKSLHSSTTKAWRARRGLLSQDEIEETRNKTKFSTTSVESRSTKPPRTPVVENPNTTTLIRSPLDNTNKEKLAADATKNRGIPMWGSADRRMAALKERARQYASEVVKRNKEEFIQQRSAVSSPGDMFYYADYKSSATSTQAIPTPAAVSARVNETTAGGKADAESSNSAEDGAPAQAEIQLSDAPAEATHQVPLTDDADERITEAVAVDQIEKSEQEASGENEFAQQEDVEGLDSYAAEPGANAYQQGRTSVAGTGEQVPLNSKSSVAASSTAAAAPTTTAAAKAPAPLQLRSPVRAARTQAQLSALEQEAGALRRGLTRLSVTGLEQQTETLRENVHRLSMMDPLTHALTDALHKAYLAQSSSSNNVAQQDEIVIEATAGNAGSIDVTIDTSPTDKK
ncbi:unnamed protein product [Amoebophrya sp. A120]|nr:unnamed protein product [Amoebophrya sp. A120]|eukprot:GSA120T00002697001.1